MEDRGIQHAYQVKDKAIRYMMLQGLSLAMLFMMSMATLRDSFSCSGSHTECDQLRSKLVCKASLVSPINVAFPLRSTVQGSQVSIMCGWETATSQIRVCITLCSLYATWMAYQAALYENRKNADSYIQASGFLSFLLAITACFDFLSVMDAVVDNEITCSLQRGSKLLDFTNEGLPCSFSSFWVVAALCLVCSVVMYFSH